MTSREIIRRVLRFDAPPRIGLMLRSEGSPKDIIALGAPQTEGGPWGRQPVLLARAPGFEGQVRLDAFGNLWGRLDPTSKGECIHGALQDGWEGLADFHFPTIDAAAFAAFGQENQRYAERYRMGMLPGMPFSLMRVLRGMENFLADLLLYEDEVLALRRQCMEYLLHIVDGLAAAGMDGVFVGEDWGTQTALLIRPEHWRQWFRPCFEAVAQRCHDRGMDFLVHSCGYIWSILPDLVEAGVDALQLDQPELLGVDRLSRELGGRVTFFCPVDIQHVMPTGDRQRIEAAARHMMEAFGSRGGGFIACDYSDWPSLQVRDEWAGWARRIFTEEGLY